MTTASPPIPRLLAMLAGAATLRERLDGALETYGDGTLARARLERWSRVLGAGDPERLRRRLDWDGLSPEDALGALGEPRGLDAEAPGWLKLLAVVLSVSRTHASRAGPRPDPLSAGEPAVPFEDLLRPFVDVSGAQLYARVHPGLGGMDSGGRLGLERALVTRLAAICGPALYRAFDLRRATTSSSLERLVALGLESADGYLEFVREMLGGGLEQLFVDLPVLGRLAATVALDWVDWSADFMRRLAEDRPELSQTFAGGSDMGAVAGVVAGLSDPHGGGRSVLRVRFASGLQLAYKPRDVGLEKGYQDVVDWLNAHGADPGLRAPRVLARPGYGWVEWVQAAPAPDREAARRYFRRAGMLAALFYGLGSTDCHQQDLVAAGEHPVLVDAETLLHARLLPHGGTAEVEGARTAARRWMEESVFEADFLPAWTAAGEGRSIDISGLGGVQPQRSVALTPRWERVNTDAMSLAQVYEDLGTAANAVRLGEGVALPWEFPDEVVEGFTAMHRLLQQRRAELLGPGGPLDRLKERQVRLVLRPTLVYQKLLAACSRTGLLGQGVDRGIELEVIARTMLTSEKEDPFWPLFRQEQAALERMDVPFFVMGARSRSLQAGGGSVEGAFAASPLEHAAERLSRFDAEDLERQVSLIRLALEVRSNDGPPPTSDGPPPASPRERGEEISDGELVGAAVEIGERLERMAIRAPDGGLAWIGLGYDERASRASLRPIGLDLYSGQSGVAVFLAALSAVTTEDRFRRLALDAVRPVLAALRETPEQVAAEIGIGGATGLGSVVYGLVACARLLKEPALLAGATAAAVTVSPARIEADRELDVVAGSAGTLLGLLALQEAIGSEAAVQRAILSGERLLAARTITPSGLRAWRSHSELPLAGFAHGAAGVAYALLLASAALDRPDFQSAAEEAVAYEATLFDPAERNWRDLRPAPGAPGQRLSAWCHGASGIGLARLGGLELFDSPQVRADVMAAVLTTREVGQGTCDQVCCGAMGRLETLLVASDGLASPQLASAAREIASSTLSGSAGRGSFNLAGGALAEGYSPGFFQGLAGIGYQLLRLARPELPSVLLFEVT